VIISIAGFGACGVGPPISATEVLDMNSYSSIYFFFIFI
jgi:hypothetical protein